LDSSGNLFGATQDGGPSNAGTVFEVAAGSGTITMLGGFNGTNGSNPFYGVIEDSSGDLFGTTYGGGASLSGTVFELQRGSGTVTPLASFNNNTGAGFNGGLTLDDAGNLFGTTLFGTTGGGNLFEVQKGSGSITILASFNANSGTYPVGDLVRDSAGNLFGATQIGGTTGFGTIFELRPGSGVITTLASFSAAAYDCESSIIEDSAGDFFGTSTQGESSDAGTVFELKAGSGVITILASFNGSNGATPYAGVTLDSRGNLYGTTFGGISEGTVFELPQGSATITILVTFYGVTGTEPLGDLAIDSSGNLYGTTFQGGAYGDGTVFEVPAGTGTVTPLASFNGANGSGPTGELALDSAGNVFGTTSAGGAYGLGTVFELAKSSATISTVVSLTASVGLYSGLVADSNGNLFGTIYAGGTDNLGSVFEVQKGSTTTTTLASLDPIRGEYPETGLVIDGNGNLFGTATSGGYWDKGTVFELQQGSSTITLLISFDAVGANGAYPVGPVFEDSYGDLFGTTEQGGPANAGTVFEVVQGSHAITMLASFDKTSGFSPVGGVVGDREGNLFGTAWQGGTAGDGVVFEVKHGTNTLSTVATFTGLNGASPQSALIPDGSGGYIGTTAAGGTENDGTVFDVSAPFGISTVTFPDWTINQPGYRQTIATIGGTGAVTFSATGTLPAGLTLGSSGILAGTPTANGTFTFTVTATDFAGNSDNWSYTVTINPQVTISTTTLANWTVNENGYRQTIVASAGTGSLTLSLSGALPGGLTFSSGGVLSGTPAAAGTFTFTVTAMDSTGASASMTYTVVIADAAFLVIPSTLSNWTLNLFGYSQTILALGGTAPFTFSLSGTLPPGLVMSSTGVIAGTPTALGTFNFVVTVADSAGASGVQNYYVTINPPAGSAVTLVHSFPGLNYTGNPVQLTPPDTILAVGPTAVVEAVNTALVFKDKTTGASLVPAQQFTSFFASLLTPGDWFSDPYVLYDDQIQRFYVGVLEITGDEEYSDFDLAISNSSNPLDGFGSFHKFTSVREGNTEFADFPKMGWNADAVIVSFNQFSSINGGFNHDLILAISKASLLSGSSTPVYFQSVVNTGADNRILLPARMHDSLASGRMDFVQTGSEGLSTVNVVQMVDVLTASPSFTTTTLTVNPYQQCPGVVGLTNEIDDRMLSADERNGRLVAAQTVGLLTDSNAHARWYEFDVSGTPKLVQQGTITPGAGIDTSYPAVAVTTADAIGLTYILSSTSQFPSMYLTGRLMGMLPGAMATPVETAAGVGYLYGGRGGDYGGVDVDPTDGSLWAGNEYAFDNSTNFGNWGTWITNFFLGVTGPVITTSKLPNWTVNQGGYQQTIQVMGGMGTLTFVTSGTLPTGLMFSGGVLSGMPTSTGSFAFSVGVIDAAGAGSSRSYTVVINPALAIITSTFSSGSLGVPYRQTVAATGGTAPVTFSTMDTLPGGLTLSSAGVLAGTPTATGANTFTVTVMDGTGAAESASVFVDISPIALSPLTLPAWTMKLSGYTQTISATGGTAPYTFSATGSLPPGLALGTDGMLSGTPTAAATYLFTVTALDSTAVSASLNYTVVINPAIALSTTTLPAWTANLGGYRQTLSATGGTGTLTFAVTTGTLPAGLTLSTSGLLAGTPTVAGTFAFTVTSTDMVGASALQSYTVVINSILSILTTTLLNGTINHAYGQTIMASGGTGSYTFALTTGALPAGLTLSSSGVLSGVPSAVSTSRFAVSVTDNVGASARMTYTVNVTTGPLLSRRVTDLASFNGSNGAQPYGGVVADSVGNLYGTTSAGGAVGEGTVFEVQRGTGIFITLASFNGTNGTRPWGSLLIDGAGNLFGTTTAGGSSGGGTVFEIVQGSQFIATLASTKRFFRVRGLISGRYGLCFSVT
jgi:uncharacterized repeat protein (TIGR03803 family)